MLKQGSNVSIGVYGRPLMMGRPTTARSLGLLAVTAYAARHSGLSMASLSCKRIIHSGFRFMQSTNKAQAESVLRLQSRSCHPNSAPKNNHLCSRLRNNSNPKDHKNDLKVTLLNAVFRTSHNATTAERFKDVIFCIKRFISWQFESQASHRLQKSLKHYSKFSKLWKDQCVALRVFGTLRRMLLTRGHLLVSAVGVYSYDWENNKISDDAIKRGARDLEILEDLFKRTIICPKCGKRQVIDQKIASIVYCMCDGKLGYTDTSRTYDGWEPFIERDNVIVWRKPHEVHTHLFHFKVYGRYEDVSLSAFMESQLNTHFRTEWDFTALQLRILHSHKDSDSDLLYWLVKFPSFFSNRDYLFKRRFHIDAESQEVTIMNEALEGNEVLPETKGVVRVSEYWSNTVIRPLEGKSKPGIEYTLTYFDNPGTRLPQSVSNFIASTGFPNFLKQNHKAALTLQSRYENGEDVYESLPYSLRYPHIELDLKTSEEKLPIEVEGHETLTLGIEDEVQETPALHIVLENNTKIAESNQETTPTEIKNKKPCIQYQIEEKSDFHQDGDSHLATIKKSEEFEIQDINNLTKESKTVSVERDDNIIPTENLIMQEETLTKEKSSLDKEVKVIIDKLNETEILSESNETENISKDEFEASKIHIKNELVSEVKVENLMGLDKSTLSTESNNSKDNIEYGTISDGSKKYSQRENKNIVQNDKSESLPDMKVEVLMGSKKVIVDLLEAMEVTSPELEQKTVLLQKVEEWAEAALRDIDDNTEFIQSVNKLRSKIEKFKERAKYKKIQSLRIMEEMEKQAHKEKELKPRNEFGHYDHSGGLDEKTLVILEKFLFTMKDMQEKDKDMRTGRGYCTDSCENIENSQRHILMKRMSEDRNTKSNLKILRENQSPEEILKHRNNESHLKVEDKTIQFDKRHDNKRRIDEIDIDNVSETVNNETETENKDDDPPKDPPAPTGTKPEGNHEEVNKDNITTTETKQMSKSVNSELASESSKMINSSTNSWIYRYVPGMPSFGSGIRVPDDKLEYTKSAKIEDISSHNIDSQSSSWYMLGLDGYFNKTTKAQESNSSVSRKETENANGCDNVDSNGRASWYWYPIIGMHKLYSWAWNAGVQV